MHIIVELESDPAIRIAVDGDLERITWQRPGVDHAEPALWVPDDKFGVQRIRLPAEPGSSRGADHLRREESLRADDALSFEQVLERKPGPLSEHRFFARGTIPNVGADEIALELVRSDRQIRDVFADPEVESASLCLDDIGGTIDDVESALRLDVLLAAGLDGAGVRVAIADGGFNGKHLLDRGHTNPTDVAASVPYPGMAPAGQGPIGHGTMCAYAAGIAAPSATLVDVPMLRGTGSLKALLSDGILAVAALRDRLLSGAIDGPLVVSSSWAIRNPKTDFPVNHPANYSHEPRHPFNIAVRALMSAGADVLFAAGNCGPDCHPNNCGFAGPPTICGANSLPETITVGAIGPKGQALGYSPVGGSIDPQKPDVLGYSQFAGGSQVDDVDRGTSAACPVVAGVVAAVRTKIRPDVVKPAALRKAIRESSRSEVDSGTWVPRVIEIPALLDALGL